MRSRVLAEVVALLVPPACVACESPLEDSGAFLCGRCRRDMPWLRGPRCPRCGLLTPCGPCPARVAGFEASWAPVAYAGPARALVAELKFRGALALATLMGAPMVAGAPPGWLEAPAVLVPVPAHPSRRRRRGFDPAALLSRDLSRRTGLAVAACLRRGGRSERQLGARRRTRLAEGRLAIEACGPVPQRAVVVDDVHTTGATLDACARALRAAGAKEVRALAYARALRGAASKGPWPSDHGVVVANVYP